MGMERELEGNAMKAQLITARANLKAALSELARVKGVSDAESKLT